LAALAVNAMYKKRGTLINGACHTSTVGNKANTNFSSRQGSVNGLQIEVSDLEKNNALPSAASL